MLCNTLHFLCDITNSITDDMASENNVTKLYIFFILFYLTRNISSSFREWVKMEVPLTFFQGLLVLRCVTLGSFVVGVEWE